MDLFPDCVWNKIVMLKYILKEYCYRPSPLCSREENETIASNSGALFERTNFAKSEGVIVVTFGCVDGYGSYSRVVILLALRYRRIVSTHGRADPITNTCLFWTSTYFSKRYFILFTTSFPYGELNSSLLISFKCLSKPSDVQAKDEEKLNLQVNKTMKYLPLQSNNINSEP